MEFYDTYKRLDNLCKDLFNSNAGITSYINEMEACQSYSYKIANWESDYRNLKHYRYIRNQIAHENWASESSLCDENDVDWLNNFYQRILNQTDPLAQYQQLVNKSTQQYNKVATNKQVVHDIPAKKQVVHDIPAKNQYVNKWLIIVIITIASLVAIGCCLYALLY